MASEVEPLYRPTRPANCGHDSSRVFVGLRVLMWFMGAVEWNNPINDPRDKRDHEHGLRHHHSWTYQRRFMWLLSTIFRILLIALSLTSFGFYMFCYFGKTDHFLRFASFMCYWPSVTFAQIICVAPLMYKLMLPRNDVIVTWLNVFDEANCVRKFSALKASTKMIPFPKLGHFLMVFAFLPALYASLQISAFIKMSLDCQYSLEYLWVIARVLSGLFFGGFCYFLYLQRVCVEEKGDETSEFISEHQGDLESCIEETRSFFKEYFELRRLILPWYSLNLFTSTFGFTCFVTWNYEISKFSFNGSEVDHDPWRSWREESIVPDETNNTFHLCVYTCDENPVLFAYNILVVCRQSIISILPIFVVMGMDLKYIWNRFRMKVNFMYSSKDREFWKNLVTFIDQLHPGNSADLIISFVFPLFGFASGLLSGKHF